MFEKKIKDLLEASVEDIKQDIKQEIKDEIYQSIEEICMEVVKEIFSNEKDKKFAMNRFSIDVINTVGGEFKDRAIEAIKSDAREICEEKARDIVMGEEFIDSVVGRIKNKQLNS